MLNKSEQKDKNAALEEAMKKIVKSHGAGSVMRMGEKPKMAVEVVSSGSIQLDIALGVGGYPKGRIIEIFGPESSGKTTVALQAIAEVQKNGGNAAFIDAEHALDPQYATALGVDIENLIISQPDTGEQALEITEALVKSGGLDIVVIDSVAALVPKAEIEGEMGDAHVGLQARLMSQALRKLTSHLNNQKTTCVFINQLREKVGVMYGNPETTPGGRALKFYSSIRLEVRRSISKKIENSQKEMIGCETTVKVVKNKVAPPFKVVTLDMIFGKGFVKEREIVNLALNCDIIEKAGSWYSYQGEKLGQGKENVFLFLEQNPNIKSEIEGLVLEKLYPQADNLANESEEVEIA